MIPGFDHGRAGKRSRDFARYLHAQSARRDLPFVEVGVSSIAKGNSARELFGSEENGRIRYGVLEKARGGTLFLDEVADMDLEAQALLQGALDTGSFLRVGGTEPVEVEVRIIAATQRQLEEEVQAETFREDLFTISMWFRCRFRRFRSTGRMYPSCSTIISIITSTMKSFPIGTSAWPRRTICVTTAGRETSWS